MGLLQGTESLVPEYVLASELLEHSELRNDGVELGCVSYIEREKNGTELMKLIPCL